MNTRMILALESGGAVLYSGKWYGIAFIDYDAGPVCWLPSSNLITIEFAEIEAIRKHTGETVWQKENTTQIPFLPLKKKSES